MVREHFDVFRQYVVNAFQLEVLFIDDVRPAANGIAFAGRCYRVI